MWTFHWRCSFTFPTISTISTIFSIKELQKYACGRKYIWQVLAPHSASSFVVKWRMFIIIQVLMFNGHTSCFFYLEFVCVVGLTPPPEPEQPGGLRNRKLTFLHFLSVLNTEVRSFRSTCSPGRPACLVWRWIGEDERRRSPGRCGPTILCFRSHLGIQKRQKNNHIQHLWLKFSPFF